MFPWQQLPWPSWSYHPDNVQQFGPSSAFYRRIHSSPPLWLPSPWYASPPLALEWCPSACSGQRSATPIEECRPSAHPLCRISLGRAWAWTCKASAARHLSASSQCIGFCGDGPLQSQWSLQIFEGSWLPSARPKWSPCPIEASCCSAGLAGAPTDAAAQRKGVGRPLLPFLSVCWLFASFGLPGSTRSAWTRGSCGHFGSHWPFGSAHWEWRCYLTWVTVASTSSWKLQLA